MLLDSDFCPVFEDFFFFSLAPFCKFCFLVSPEARLIVLFESSLSLDKSFFGFFLLVYFGLLPFFSSFIEMLC